MRKDPFLDILHYSNEGDSPKYHIKPSTVDSFFNTGDRKIVIPKYQRPYSWSKDNVLALLKDIDDLDSSGQWFLGPIFVVKKTGDMSNITLLDGQQRITTFVLFFLVLYRRISFLIEEYSAPIQEEQNSDRVTQLEKLQNYQDTLRTNLIITQQGVRTSRFDAEDALKSIFSKFIIDWFNRQNTEVKFKTLLKEFESKCLQMTGAPSAKVLLDNFKIIQDKLVEKLDNNYDDIDRINNLLLKILYAFWIIEIPLQKATASIRIFESLNNRGRPLTLVDKFRYRTLIDKTVYENTERTTEVSKKWKKIFTLFEETKESKETFFQYFFMSKLGVELALNNHADFFEYYEKLYADNESELDQFLDEIIYFLKFHKCCKNNNTWKDLVRFQQTELNGLKRAKITGIFELSKHVMRYSKSSRFLFFKSLRDNPEPSWSLIIELFKINQHVFWSVFNNRTPPNKIRSDNLSLCKEESRLSELLNPPDNLKIIRDLESKIILNDQGICRILILFYTYLTEPIYLNNWNSEAVDRSEVEHLMPKAWRANWLESKDYSVKQAVEFLETQKSKYTILDIEGFINYLKRPEVEFSPREYETTPYSNTATMIEFIGNRWVISCPKNIKLSNRSLQQKKQIIDDYASDLTYPSVDNKVGINQYDVWNGEKILERSLIILNTLFTKLSEGSAWDQFDE